MEVERAVIVADYWAGESQVLDAGRALALALRTNDQVRIQGALQHLAAVGEARETTVGTVSGFRGEGDEDAPAQEPDVELDQVLAELEIGQTFVAASAVGQPGQDGRTEFAEALVRLEADRVRRNELAAARAGFRGATEPEGVALPALQSAVASFLDDVVTRTTAVGADVTTGLVALPASAVEPWLGAAAVLDDLPVVGNLARLGLRALRRAVNALLRWVPAALREKARELATQWWTDHGSQGVAERLLEVDSVRRLAVATIDESVTADRLTGAAAAIEALSDQHAKATATLGKVVRVINGFAGPLAASVPVAVAWLYGAAAAGLVAAIACALWLGRDALDTGAVWQRVDGVQVILAGLAS